MLGTRWAQLPGVQPCLEPWLEAQAVARNLPFTLATVVLQPATPFCSINSWRAGSSLHTCCLLWFFPSTLATEIQGLSQPPRTWEASIFALKVQPRSCKNRHVLGDRDFRRGRWQGCQVPTKLGCLLRPGNVYCDSAKLCTQTSISYVS